MKKIIFSLLLIVYLALSHFSVTNAIDCDGNLPDEVDQLNEYIQACESKVNDLRTEKQSLTAAISLLNSKINLTQAQIRNTNVQISQLTEEIGTLSVVIDDLNNELDALTKVYLSRVREAYKNRHTNIALSLLSDSEQNFQSRLKYLETTHKRDQIIMHELESARINFDQQKTTKEEKQAEIESLKTTLESQKQVLGAQESQKQQLLVQTQNDELKYQSLRKDALARVAELASYTAGRDTSLLTGTTSCDDWGCYYNQRDAQWGSRFIGNSDMTMSRVGCLVTAAAMIATHYNKDITPGDIADSTYPFHLDTADMRFDWSGNVKEARVTRNPIGCKGDNCLSIIDSELSQNRPVIVRINATNIVGTHFIVITEKKGDSYIMKDPLEADGNNISFTQKHSINSLTRVDKVVVN